MVIVYDVVAESFRDLFDDGVGHHLVVLVVLVAETSLVPEGGCLLHSC